ncbi:MAG: hypothetical protein JNK05_32550 [Myxococcales bacterium]|nr:hypothetical protein [Myxococcales bacterium]
MLHRKNSRKLDRVVRFVSALSMGGLGAVRGCGGGGSACLCPTDSGYVIDAAVSTACTAAETDAGCSTLVSGSGPLPPPELDC